MKLYPAIDLKDGKCVRLTQGDPDRQTIYSDSPATMAEKWAELGADWIHVVNLDGALGDPDKSAKNLDALQMILDSVTTPVQFGGGLRTIEDINRVLTMGVSRVVIGSMAADRPRQMLDILAQFGPAQIALGLDVRDGKVATSGWRTLSETDPVKLTQMIHAAGLTHVIFTDISRDGMLSGINLEASLALAKAGQNPHGNKPPFQVIVSGGVANMEDVRQVKAHETEGLEGLIIGKALYTGAIDLAEAVKIARGE